MKMNTRGFTLLEILGGLIVVMTLTYLALPGINAALVKMWITAEDAELAALKSDILRSFESEDFTNYNIASFTGQIPATDSATMFINSDNVSGLAATVPQYWFAKIARGRGTPFTTAAPTRAAQPALANILLNRFDRGRIVAVRATSTEYRYIIVSVLARREQLVFPNNDGSADWFDAVWNTNWDTRTGTFPTALASRLTADQVAAWNGDGSGTMLYRARVVTITQPLCTVNVSNSHPTLSAWLSYNGGNNVETSAAGTGVTTISGILQGRTLRVLRGTAFATASESHRIVVRQPVTDVVIQSFN